MYKRNFYSFLMLYPLLALYAPVFATAAIESSTQRLQVVATTADLGNLAKEVGGAWVDVSVLVNGSEDPHEAEARPSFLFKINAADLVIANGLGLEGPWLASLVAKSSNIKIQVPQGFLDLGESVSPLPEPTSNKGHHAHTRGNPHYTLDPLRVAELATVVANRLGTLSPDHKKSFEDQAQALGARLKILSEKLSARFKATPPHQVLTYHPSLNYFCNRFGLKVVGTFESVEGQIPTAQHISELLSDKKYDGVDLILLENLYSDKLALKILARRPKIRIAKVPASTQSERGIETFEQLYTEITNRIEGSPR